MPIRSQTSTEYFNSIFLLYFVLLAWQIVILSILFYVRNFSWDTWDAMESQDIFVIIALLASIASVFTSILMSKAQLPKIQETTDLQAKLALYYKSLLMRFVLLEWATIVSIIFYFIDWNSILLILSLIMIAVFAVNKPSREKIIESINLSMEQKLKLENPEEIVAEIHTQY